MSHYLCNAVPSPHLPYGRTYKGLPHKGPGVAVRGQTHSQRGTHGSLPQSHSLQEQSAAQSHQVHTQHLLTVQYLSRSWSQQQRQRVQRPQGHKRHGGERGSQPTQRWPDPDPDLAGPGRLWPCDSRPWLSGSGREREAGGHRAVDREMNGLADEQERNYTGKLQQPDR